MLFSLTLFTTQFEWFTFNTNSILVFTLREQHLTLFAHVSKMLLLLLTLHDCANSIFYYYNLFWRRKRFQLSSGMSGQWEPSYMILCVCVCMFISLWGAACGLSSGKATSILSLWVVSSSTSFSRDILSSISVICVCCCFFSVLSKLQWDCRERNSKVHFYRWELMNYIFDRVTLNVYLLLCELLLKYVFFLYDMCEFVGKISFFIFTLFQTAV